MSHWNDPPPPDDDAVDYSSLSDWSRAEHLVSEAAALTESADSPDTLADLRRAVELLREAIDLNPHTPAWRLALAATLSRLGDHAASADVLKSAAEAEPDHPPTLLALARELFLSARHRESLEVVSRILELDRTFEPAYCLKTEVLVELRRFDSAEETYYQARLIEDHCCRCDLAIARGLLIRGQPKRAVPLLERASHESPGSEVLALLARAYADAGDYERAVGCYHNLLKRPPTFSDQKVRLPVVWVELGQALEHLRRPAEAMQALERALALEADFAPAHAAAARHHLAQNRPAEALAFARSALRCDPTLPGLHLLIAQASLDAAPRGHVPPEVRHHLRRELQVLADTDAPSLLHLALLLDRSRRPSLALRVLRRLVTIAPTSAGAWQNLAVLCFRLRRFDEGLDASFRGLRIAPGHPDILHNLALAHARRRDLVAARSYARLAAEFAPKDQEPHRLLMRLRFALFERTLRAWFRRPM